MIREAYLRWASAAADVLRSPSVAAAWDEPSVLPGYRVSGLSGHLARNIVLVEPVLDRPASGASPIPLLDHYTRNDWLDADPQGEVHLGIRERGAKAAADGPDVLARHVTDTIGRLQETIPAQPTDRVVDLGGWSLALDDFLLACLVEVTVHSDDLAVSVGLPTPDLPPQYCEDVIALLARLAVRRHGPMAVVRAFSRDERSPKTISAF
ncbi:maleylpyruvate isomerase N-terminal domain-containing protein [Streptomyces chartreusis]